MKLNFRNKIVIVTGQTLERLAIAKAFSKLKQSYKSR